MKSALLQPEEAETGEALTWKLALWGTYRDKKALQRLRRLFPSTLEDFRKARRWYPPRRGSNQRSERGSKYEIEYVPELKGENTLMRRQ